MKQISKFEETKLVIITRSDFEHPGYALPQSLHAIADFAYEHPETFHRWKKESNSVICLSVDSEERLLKYYGKLSRLTPATKFYEPDVDQWTSICVYGTPDIRKKLSHLPLALKAIKNEYVVD